MIQSPLPCRYAGAPKAVHAHERTRRSGNELLPSDNKETFFWLDKAVSGGRKARKQSRPVVLGL